MATVIPCKRPKVTVTPRSPGDDRHDADCLVPGCSWTYPADKQFMALKSDANEQATRHRRDHREAVPGSVVNRHPDGGYEIGCSCGLVRHDGTTTTRTDAENALTYHLVQEHGLVSC